MSIFNYHWKHNNIRTKLTLPARKIKQFPFSHWSLMIFANLFIYLGFISLNVDVIPQLQILEEDVTETIFIENKFNKEKKIM